MDQAFEYGSPTALVGETSGAIVAGRRGYDLAREPWNGAHGFYAGAFKGQDFVLTHEPPANLVSAKCTLRSILSTTAS